MEASQVEDVGCPFRFSHDTANIRMVKRSVALIRSAGIFILDRMITDSAYGQAGAVQPVLLITVAWAWRKIMSASSIEIMERMEEDEVLEFLCEFGYLEGAALGIAKKVIDKGRQSLTGKQADVFEKFVEPYLNMECEVCGTELPTSEIIPALTDDHELCSWCAHRASKDD